jgi:TrmH family RNA methyltransferase
MQIITSVHNPKIKLARTLETRKGRQNAGLFLIEGTKLLSEALTFGAFPVATFATADWWESYGALPPFNALPGDSYEVPEAVLKAMATTQTPDAVVAMLPLPSSTPEPLPLRGSPLVLIAHGLQDPGNLGTIIRAADAAGADAVIVTEQTADPYGPKAVRASMGSLFHVKVQRWTLEGWAKAHADLPLYAMSLDAEGTLYAQDLGHGAAFLIGNEGAGLTTKDEAIATRRLKIPIYGHAESLNAAMAATLCLYEAARQRALGVQ